MELGLDCVLQYLQHEPHVENKYKIYRSEKGLGQVFPNIWYCTKILPSWQPYGIETLS